MGCPAKSVPSAVHVTKSLIVYPDTAWGGGGHAAALHGTFCVRAGQAAPPFAACLVTVRLWGFVPVVPHAVAEQLPESDHPETWQSTGHGGALHGTLCVRDGQAAPPFAAGVVTVRVCV